MFSPEPVAGGIWIGGGEVEDGHAGREGASGWWGGFSVHTLTASPGGAGSYRRVSGWSARSGGIGGAEAFERANLVSKHPKERTR